MVSLKYSKVFFWYYFISLTLIIFKNFVWFETLFVLITVIYLSFSIVNRSTFRTILIAILYLFTVALSLIRGINLTLILVGSFSIFVFPIILTLARNSKHDNIIPLFRWFVILFTISTFIQFFYSKNLFGLLELNYYTKLDSNVTPRGVSIFTRSPQSTAFIAGTILLFSVGYNELKINRFLIILVFLTGILTFSKIFIFFLFAIFVINFSIRKIFQFLLIVLPILLSLPIVESTFNLEGLGRLITIIDTISNYNNYVTFNIWTSQLNLNFSSVYDLLFGKGLGILSRSNKEIFDVLGFYSSESYILQIYNEIGLTGIFILFGILLLGMNRLIKKKFIALILISFFNPALYGITISFLIYGMILPIVNLSSPSLNSTYERSI